MSNSHIKPSHYGLQTQWLRRGVLAYVLWPLSALMYLMLQLRKWLYRTGLKPSYRPEMPIIIVGNIFVGGTGKTPVSIALSQAMQARGWQVGLISRGYGVKLGSQARTAFGAHAQASLIGDEPSLLAAYAPIAVHPNRQKAIEKLRHDYPETNLIICDDGLQHYALQRDIEIVVQDLRGVGNGFLLPAGPLREPTSRLQQVDYLITNRPIIEHEIPSLGEPYRSAQNKPKPLSMSLQLDYIEHLAGAQRYSIDEFKSLFQDKPLSAIAGIGQPERFFDSLRRLGLVLQKTQGFSDHHHFQVDDFKHFSQSAVLMTAKDAAKCRQFNLNYLWVVHVRAEFSDAHFFDEIHEKLLHSPYTHL